MANRFGTLSGKSQVIGLGIPQTFPIQLDPAAFEGAVVYADNGELRYSDGTSWLVTGTGPQGTQGTQGFLGNQGVQGDYGPGFTIIGSIAGPGDQSTLNSNFPGAVVGDGVIDESDDTLWIYDGGNWINIGGFRGVQGLQGVQGNQGVQGTLGNEGIQGERGHRGFQGERGVQGYRGIQGNRGFQGTQGYRGPQGTQGFTGIQGSIGFQGTQGVQGPQASQGVQGTQGFFGFQGYAGNYGGVSFEFDLDAATFAQDPTAGKFAINSADATLATAMFIDSFAKAGKDVSALLNAIDQVKGPVKGYIQLTRISDITQSITYEIVNVTDNTGWLTLNINWVASTANVLTGVVADPGFILSFVQTGAQGVRGYQGVQGFVGIQGNQGVQGTQGVQGRQGTTGIQGAQGTQGTQGDRGFQGNQGTQGTQGLQGVQGSTGGFGGLTYDYTYSNSTTAADPGQGYIRFDTTILSAAVSMYIDDQDDAGNDLSALFAEIQSVQGSPKGYLKVIDGTDKFKFTTYRVDSATDSAGYWTLVLVYINGATNYSNDADMRITFSRNGDQGIQGVQGSQGIQGAQGVQGGQGTQGIQGNQGTQGFQGFQGVQGESIQGVQGNQGPQGTQGFRGFQGVQGNQGTTGFTGIQGTQGLQGLQGLQGEQGEYGGLTFVWNYSSNVVGASNPGTNNFKFNNSNPVNATLITLDDVPADQYDTEIDALLDWIKSQPGTPKGYLKIQVGAGGAPGPGGHHWLVYEITDYTWDSGAKEYGYFDVVYIDGNATSWTTVTDTHGIGTLITFIPKGPQGIQGFTGIQGNQGLQGNTGQGTQGITGSQGLQGNTGAAGSFGGVTFDYTFSTDTVNNDPTPGYLKFNNSTYSSVSAMYIDDRDDNFVLLEPFLRTIDDSTSPIKGHFKVTKKGTPETFQIFTISALTEVTGYFIVSCAFVSGNGTFVNDEDITITFARTGDIGSTGSVGPQGVQGPQGLQGVQGVQGRTGQGVQGGSGGIGTQGPQGIQGVQGGIGGIGSQGLQGHRGFQGDLGFQGPGGSGAQGVIGIQGPQGVQGFTGQDGTGLQGIQGVQGTQGNSGQDGAQGAGGGEGQPGPRGFQGVQGVQGVQGNQGPAGIGAQGFEGAGSQGIQGVQGDTGQTGVQGFIGDGGVQGVQGVQGNSGLIGVGIQGVQGVQGVQGFQGIQGADGAGSQGLQGTQGYQGIGGPPGAGTQGVQGYYGFQGNQGFPGAQGQSQPGSQGLQGTQGIQGNQGATGAGLTGSQGIQGIQGFQGDPGDIGSGGTQGVQGTQGHRGFQGFIGAGEPGIQGFRGYQGFAGETGGFGAQGPAGEGGTQGATGENGVQGFPGADGVGAAGPAGAQGSAGPGGVQGFPGESITGPQGIQGVQGAQGEKAAQGAQGPAGAGAQGATGDEGFQGAPGFQGAQGSRGFQGGVGAASTEPGVPGAQGAIGYQGIQGPGGATDEVEVNNLNVSALQTTSMFLTMVQGGSGARPLYGTTGPNYDQNNLPNTGAQTNLYYTGALDQLTVENVSVEGGITLGGVTNTTWPGGGGSFDGTATNTVSTGTIVFNDGALLQLGTGGDIDIYDSGTGAYIDCVATHDLFIREGTSTRFTFDTGVGDFTASGSINSLSDRRVKENIETITGALDKVLAIRGVSYNKIGSERHEVGVIAQEVEQILPEVVTTSEDETGTKSVSYGNIVGVLVEAIKELKAEIEELKKK